ncbi:MAG: TfoX/Sxy family protein [Thermodesulfobacteriota bacterium]|nr:MAG: TfoX/Sxy family protein [Thermodesulfobacteriota bacterium]
MPVSDDYLAFVIERLECVGQVSARRMFGGAGLYLDGLFFALVSDDTLYLKTGEGNRGDYEALGMGPFRPFSTYAMSYHELPARILDDDSQLEAWCARAIDAASEKKPPSRRRAKR